MMRCCLRAQRPRASNKGLWPCPLHIPYEISLVSLNLLMILCTVDDEICRAFAIWHWGMLFLKYSTIFLRTLSQTGEPLPIFTSERLCLFKTCLLSPGTHQADFKQLSATKADCVVASHRQGRTKKLHANTPHSWLQSELVRSPLAWELAVYFSSYQ